VRDSFCWREVCLFHRANDPIEELTGFKKNRKVKGSKEKKGKRKGDWIRIGGNLKILYREKPERKINSEIVRQGGRKGRKEKKWGKKKLGGYEN